MDLCRLLVISPLFLALTGCGLAELGENPFRGCYDNSCVDRPQPVPTVPALASISAFASHVCGLTGGGEAWCWGENTSGQLGDGTDTPRSGPVPVAGNLRFSAIAVGWGFTCAIALDGRAYCWGAGALGQSGPDACVSSSACAKSPLSLGDWTFTSIAAGTRHACAVDANGAAWCWGFNYRGETGSGVIEEFTLVPHQVTSSTPFVRIGAGDSFTCALTTNGQAQCWGSAWRGELGRQVSACVNTFVGPEPCTPIPGPVNTSASFTTLTVSNSHSCGLTESGTAICWGDNGQGQLGRGGFGGGIVPAPAHVGMSFTVINASGAATCATPTSGPSVCWGLNLMGKLGVGSRLELSTAPLPIFGEPRYSAIAGGPMHVCALDAAGAAFCWGSGRRGELGTGERLP